MNKIEVKVYRDKAKDVPKGRIGELKPPTVTLSNHDLGHLVESSFGEKLGSGRPIFKSVLFLRNQVYNAKERAGELVAFQPDQ